MYGVFSYDSLSKIDQHWIWQLNLSGSHKKALFFGKNENECSMMDMNDTFVKAKIQQHNAQLQEIEDRLPNMEYAKRYLGALYSIKALQCHPRVSKRASDLLPKVQKVVNEREWQNLKQVRN